MKGIAMLTRTVSKPTTRASSDHVDIDAIDHLHAHPAVAALLAKQYALRERLCALDSAIREQRQVLTTLEGEEVLSAAELGAAWQPSSTLQDARGRLAALCDEQRMLEAAAPHVQQQLEQTKTAVCGTLMPQVQAAGQPVMARLVAAMEELQAAQAAAQAFAQKAYRLVGSHMVPLGLIQDPTLTGRLRYIRDTLRTQFHWTDGR